MPYTKLPFLADSDHVVGFQTINQARDNLLEHYGVLSLRHGVVESGAQGFLAVAPAVPRRYGNHNDTRIPRSVYRLSPSTAVSTAGFPFGQPQFNASTQNVVSGVERIDVGVYFATVLGLQQFYSVVEPTVPNATTVRVVIPTSFLPGQATPPGITFECLELSGTTWVAADFDFDCAIYGTL